MKKVESFILIALVGVFVYCLFELILERLGTDLSLTRLTGLEVNVWMIYGGFLAAGFTAFLFPLWNAKRGKISGLAIKRYILAYKAQYAMMCVVYLGLLAWYTSEGAYNLLWVLGAVLVLLGSYLFYVIIKRVKYLNSR